MGRPRLHDWPDLYREFSEGQYASVAAFAEEKGLHPVSTRKEFRKLAAAHPKRNAKGAAKQKGAEAHRGRQQNKTPGKTTATPRRDGSTPWRPGSVICGARARSAGGQPCRRPPGWGTDHPGNGRCKLHGGRSTGAPGNQNALKHGAYADLILSQLTPEEQAVFAEIPADDGLREELRIVRFKLLRLLQPMNRQVAIGTQAGAEIVTLEVDEITRATGIARLVDSARKIVKDLRDSGQEDDGSLDALLAAIEASRQKVSQDGI